jgi:uncharacterized membrane protein YdjX (TVP38/TMEM64 family)
MSGVWLALAVIYHKAGVSWSFIIPLIPFQIPTIHDVYYYRALAYIPLTVLAVPASILTLGGGYLFGLPVGFVADSIGATIGATAAFLLGRTIGRPYVLSKCKDYPKFQAVAIAIQRSGFKVTSCSQ